jgi:hypothetical protein
MEPIITDRPDQTESTAIVPKGYFQGEHGFAVNLNDFYNEFSIASTLLRYGINPNFELRFEIDPKLIDAIENIAGFNPVAFGLKTRLMENDFLDLSIITHIEFAQLSSQLFQPPFTALKTRLTVAHNLSDIWSIGYNAGIEWTGINPAPIYIYTFTSGLAIGDRCGVFAEVFGDISTHDDLPGEIKYDQGDHNFDAGFTCRVSNNLQLDISAGSNLPLSNNDYFISTGFAYRFNTLKNNENIP